MGYYSTVGNAYCINGVHYDALGNIEDDQPHGDEPDDNEEGDRCRECGNTPETGACFYCKMD